MSSDSWKNRLKTTLTTYSRVALIGVGSELYGDDAAGVYVIRQLQQQITCTNCLLVDAGSAPESSLGVLRKYRPEIVILIDAALMKQSPGTVKWLNPDQTDGLSASTHTLPLSALTHYLVSEYGCTVILLGIQPMENCLAAPLSPQVQQAVDCIADFTGEVLRSLVSGAERVEIPPKR